MSKKPMTQAVQYLIYISTNGAPQIDYAARDEEAGILGSLREVSAPLLKADSIEDATEKAYAHLGRNPADLLFLADSNNLLYDILLNRQYHRDCNSLSRGKMRGWACFILALISLVLTVSLGLGSLGLLICGAAVSLYLLLLLTRAFNEIQAGFACIILLIVTALLIQGNSAIQKPAPTAANPGIQGELHSSNSR
ncbi:MAG: hypothetical protein ACKO0N_05410 [Planctomycetota bacterium]